MFQYIRRLQGTNKVKGSSLVVTIPYPLTQVLELSRDNIVLVLARVKNEKAIVLRKMQKEELGI